MNRKLRLFSCQLYRNRRRKRCQEHRTVTMVLPLPIISDRWWMIDLKTNPSIAQATGGKVQELSWKAVSDPKQYTPDAKTQQLTKGQVYVDFSRGAWFLMALDEQHTLGEYYSWADPGGYIPDGATAFAASSIVDTFKGMHAFTLETPNLQCLKVKHPPQMSGCCSIEERFAS